MLSATKYHEMNLDTDEFLFPEYQVQSAAWRVNLSSALKSTKDP
jgi:hypothetical protein